MKKLVLTSACILAAGGAAFAQGTVLWNAIVPTGFTAQVNPSVESSLFPTGVAPGGSVGFTGTTAGSYFYELLYNTSATAVSAPTTLASLDTWKDTSLEAQNSTSSAGKVSVIGSTTDATVPFTAQSSIILVGWSANLGTTWSAASTALNDGLAGVVGQGFFGTSNAGFITPNSGNPGAAIIGTSAGEIDSPLTQLYAVNAVPEPTTIALGVMGAASLLALRRKKA
jgi:hypothetical protein